MYNLVWKEAEPRMSPSLRPRCVLCFVSLFVLKQTSLLEIVGAVTSQVQRLHSTVLVVLHLCSGFPKECRIT